MPLTTISPSSRGRAVSLTGQPCAGWSGSVTHARIVPPASHTHGPRTSGAIASACPRIAARGAEEGNV